MQSLRIQAICVLGLVCTFCLSNATNKGGSLGYEGLSDKEPVGNKDGAGGIDKDFLGSGTEAVSSGKEELDREASDGDSRVLVHHAKNPVLEVGGLDMEVLDNEQLLFLASLTFESDRLEDSFEYALTVIKRSLDIDSKAATALDDSLSNYRRDLVSSVRRLRGMQSKLSAEMNHVQRDLADLAIKKACERIITLCQRVVNELEGDLKHRVSDDAVLIRLLRIRADCYRHIAAQLGVLSRDNAEPIGHAEANYAQAIRLTETALRPSDALRMGVAVNYGVLLRHIMFDEERARTVEKKAFDEARSDISDVDLTDEAVETLKALFDLQTLDP